ncbi:hypothetical protein MHPYR_520050 [uncultured Mycobacterium sp.]|uniref:Scaffolding protein n=1 Tax=uncultured Mycobacterium sp. TaxID=171292 RepID=A0A1Y5PHT1_9MYCO|nr:hypothetical protein MHPYR_520050 [uncultured Mycobacterium sp.]
MSETTITAGEVTAAEIADDEVDETTPPNPTDDGDGEPKKVGVRQKLADVEDERDALQARLDGFYDSVLTREAEAIGLKPALLKAVGVSVADHVGDDGVIDYAAVATAMDGARAELGLPRRPKPNPLAGKTRTSEEFDGEPTWGSTFAQHASGQRG